MKCSLVISNILEEISSLSPAIGFLYFFVLITEEGLGKGEKEGYARLNADFGDGVANG